MACIVANTNEFLECFHTKCLESIIVKISAQLFPGNNPILVLGMLDDSFVSNVPAGAHKHTIKILSVIRI